MKVCMKPKDRKSSLLPFKNPLIGSKFSQIAPLTSGEKSAAKSLLNKHSSCLLLCDVPGVLQRDNVSASEWFVRQ